MSQDQARLHDAEISDQADGTVAYDGPAGGWGSLQGISRVFGKEWSSPAAIETLMRQNKPKGFMCVSCSWAKPADYHTFEFCENGAKATLWELTSARCTPEFFAEHSVTELRDWSDYDLEMQGRLTHPMRYDADTDHYVPCSWDEAFQEIGEHLRSLDPKSAVFYASGRASLETSYLYALFARLYGHNNLPDSSNMCHETTSVALKKLLGVGVGTVVFDDLSNCDAMFFFGQNTGSNSPRFLHPLQEAAKRGVEIITFNPVREKGLESFVNPQNPTEMLTGRETRISSQYHQVKAGGDVAVLIGLCKHVFARDDEAKREGRRVLDVDFIEAHTHGFDAFEDKVRATSWEEIERESGLSRAAIEAAGEVYVKSDRVIGIYGMGLTQHAHGFLNIAMFVNLLLMKGNIGRDGTGISPVRGHSNVQGQRTVGISEKPELVPLDKMAEQFGFDPPRDKGLNTVEACHGILAGKVRAFIGLGGNFVRAIPERDAMEEAWPRMQLTVQIATKLNRSHLVNGKSAYLLPCLGRTEQDVQASGPQAVTMEDTFSCIQGSIGLRKPASEHLKSELAIVAGIAKATLPDNPKLKWDDWVGDYGLVRDLIAESYPEMFHDFNARMFTPGGFYKGNAARERIWNTESGKAEFTTPERLNSIGFDDAPGRYRLITMRSNDQFNTTIYGMSDRLRGIEGRRDVLLINPDEMAKAGLSEGQEVWLEGDAGDGVHREAGPLRVTPFRLPDGCLGAYYPEMNPLIPVWHHDGPSKTPAAKSVPVRIRT
ncbi:molybdopterin-dependent oxidoreductase alpha subunit [Rhodopseudomonas thermotolerans]|uniref:Molybdopterin-dependent oxidoreductase alpha subunit n=2 Tax=Rhodopseudomonas TaxID=1073 RepID=A0A336JWS2_9BRAD|nr:MULTISPECIES: FdhF/YdeP family oxidoreductase [Rhodopseudomonas]RED28009.1 molybdopterin-dependent oxidoreductase alpha subunit [Rhodopseudomonas pentothenatexigens]REF91263.1 molybdopterin-dependent oxidoreductase alpha subunit [Rhodopseudomonas thermotolerans]SSW92739.1 molybdopterin-dependent oxidoreductase alpha subunit [Rhodopseudomonas pentothenatexigens]